MAAAIPKEQAARAVLAKFPQGSTAELASKQLNLDQIATFGLQAGEVIEYSLGMTLGRSDDQH